MILSSAVILLSRISISTFNLSTSSSYILTLSWNSCLSWASSLPKQFDGFHNKLIPPLFQMLQDLTYVHILLVSPSPDKILLLFEI